MKRHKNAFQNITNSRLLYRGDTFDNSMVTQSYALPYVCHGNGVPMLTNINIK